MDNLLLNMTIREKDQRPCDMELAQKYNSFYWKYNPPNTSTVSSETIDGRTARILLYLKGYLKHHSVYADVSPMTDASYDDTHVFLIQPLEILHSRPSGRPIKLAFDSYSRWSLGGCRLPWECPCIALNGTLAGSQAFERVGCKKCDCKAANMWIRVGNGRQFLRKFVTGLRQTQEVRTIEIAAQYVGLHTTSVQQASSAILEHMEVETTKLSIFAQLPPELVIKVFRFALNLRKRLRPYRYVKKIQNPRWELPAAMRPILDGVLLTNKLVHHECIKYLYSTSRFSFSRLGDFFRFIKHLSDFDRPPMRHVELCLDHIEYLALFHCKTVAAAWAVADEGYEYYNHRFMEDFPDLPPSSRAFIKQLKVWGPLDLHIRLPFADRMGPSNMREHCYVVACQWVVKAVKEFTSDFPDVAVHFHHSPGPSRFELTKAQKRRIKHVVHFSSKVPWHTLAETEDGEVFE